MVRRALLLDSLRVSKYTFLKVDDNRLFYHCTSSIFKRLMRRVFFHIIISLILRVESEDKSVAHAILLACVRSLYDGGSRVSGTCRPSMEVSLPPVMDKMYGLRVSGCTQDFFKPKSFDVIYAMSGLCAMRSGAFRTDLTAMALVGSLNCSRTTCVVYGISGA